MSLFFKDESKNPTKDNEASLSDVEVMAADVQSALDNEKESKAKVRNYDKKIASGYLKRVIDISGWEPYEAFCIMNEVCEKEKITFKQFHESKLWIEYKKAQGDKLALQMKGEKTSNERWSKIDEKTFYDKFYSDKQKEAIREIKNGVITFKTLSNFLEVEFPKELANLDENIFEDISCRCNRLNQKSVFFCVEKKMVKPEVVKKSNPRCIIGRKQYEKEFAGLDIPFIPCTALRGYVVQLSKLWRDRFPAKSIGISGSVGKTSTTDMIGLIAGCDRNMYKIYGNQNTTWQIAKFVYNLSMDTDVYVQECSGSYFAQLERSASIISPDIFVLTNIGNGHIGNYYGRRELLLHEKLSLDRHAKKGAVGVINWDDDMLKHVQYNHDIVSFAINDETADFVGKNIVEKDGRVILDVVEKNGTVTPVVINTCGIHNAYNALASFAVGVQLGIEREKIQKAIASFRTFGVRQNLVWIGGRHLYLDCYSVTENSMRTAVVAMNNISVKDGCRKIAVLADIPALGDESEAVHRRIGKMVAEVNSVDEVFFYGNEMAYAKQEADALGVKSRYTTEQAVLESWLREDTIEGDLICFKSTHKMMLQWVLDNVYSTGFFAQDELTGTAPVKRSGGLSYKLVDDYGSTVVKMNSEKSVVDVEKEVDGYPTRIIGKQAFMNCAITEINIPEPTQTISETAFRNCRNLVKVNLPSTLRYIGPLAFEGCSAIDNIELPDGMVTIEESAFTGCINLKSALIPDSVITIGDNAFEKETLIVCSADSYAKKWAEQNGYKFKIN